TWLVVSRNESAPEQRLRAEHLQEVLADTSALAGRSGVVVAKLCVERPARRQRLENRVVVVKELKAARWHCSDRSLLPPPGADVHDALRVRMREVESTA